MIKSLLSTSLLLLATTTFAQTSGIWHGHPADSTQFNFEVTSSLNNTVTMDNVDTTGATLWDIGTTSKSFFSMGTGNTLSIMTDTTDTYPTNANDWFTLKLNRTQNRGAIISFRHKYQTTAERDGGMVEYSYDHGTNWTNVLDSCNVDGQSGWSGMGIVTDNFYTKADTLLNGEWAFSGTSSGWIQSAFQLPIGPLPVKTTISWNCIPDDTVYIRFRFVSDDTLETLDGWMIDDIRIEHDYWTGVKNLAKAGNLKVYPTPSYDGLINFPAIEGAQHYTITISNITGSNIMTSPYKPTLDLSAQPKGLYFYKVTNGETIYTGRLVIE